MPKSLYLFGAYLQKASKDAKKSFKRSQITRILPPKSAGRTPSASSQMTLWGGDDYNMYTRKTWSGRWNYFYPYPNCYRKDFKSEALNSTVFNLRVTPNAIYSMDDAGGFDNYVMRTPPEELRSATGEKMRDVMYYYMQRPDVKDWGLPWKVFLRKKNRKDPEYARYAHEAKKQHSGLRVAQEHSRFSPYYLPRAGLMHPARQEFLEGSVQPNLKTWWRERPALEPAFRRRLTEAKPFERAHADHREPMGFRYGETMGGGGAPNTCPRPRSKTHHFRQLRPY